MVKTRKNQAPGAYAAGLIGLVLMAIAEFLMSAAILGMSSAAAGFSFIYSFGLAFLGAPIWLTIGIVCIGQRKKTSEAYCTDLTVLGILNLLGTIMVAFCIFLPITGWWIQWNIVAGWIAYRTLKRSKGNSPNWNRIKIILLVLSATVCVVGALVVNEVIFGTTALRLKWKKQALANTTVFEVTEDKARSTSEALYLKIDGVDGDVRFSCYRNVQQCGYGYSGLGEMGRNGARASLSMYLWQKNSAQINQILARYPSLRPEGTGLVHVYGYDRDEIESFLMDLMEIDDIGKLYQAYVETKDKTDKASATAEFDFLFNVRDSGREKEIGMFEWLQKQRP